MYTYSLIMSMTRCSGAKCPILGRINRLQGSRIHSCPQYILTELMWQVSGSILGRRSSEVPPANQASPVVTNISRDSPRIAVHGSYIKDRRHSEGEIPTSATGPTAPVGHQAHQHPSHCRQHHRGPSARCPTSTVHSRCIGLGWMGPPLR